MSLESAKKIAQIFMDYCIAHKYQLQKNDDSTLIRLDISNFTERANINIYHTNSIVVQGKPNLLKNEMNKVKETIERGSQPISQLDGQRKLACTATYDILISELRTQLFELFKSLGLTLEPESVTKKPLQKYFLHILTLFQMKWSPTAFFC